MKYLNLQHFFDAWLAREEEEATAGRWGKRGRGGGGTEEEWKGVVEGCHEGGHLLGRLAVILVILRGFEGKTKP